MVNRKIIRGTQVIQTGIVRKGQPTVVGRVTVSKAISTPQKVTSGVGIEDIVNIFGLKAVVPKKKPIVTPQIERGTTIREAKVFRTPARTIARQFGVKTAGEIKEIRAGRRVDPFGRVR